MLIEYWEKCPLCGSDTYVETNANQCSLSSLIGATVVCSDEVCEAVGAISAFSGDGICVWEC